MKHNGDKDQDTFPEALLWANDAPLFIDDENLARLYDAVVKPLFKEVGPRVIRLSKERKKELEGKVGGKGKLALPSWLSSVLAAEVEIGADVQGAASTGKVTEQSITLEQISGPQRQLEQLVVFYFLNRPERLLTGGVEAPLAWQQSGKSTDVPRALAFVDLPPGTKFIPMTAEFENGKVVTLFDQLAQKASKKAPNFNREAKREYWAWFTEHFDSRHAMDVIEAASSKNGKIDWIDFRIPLNDKVDTMHLHLEARRRYYTGALAYMVVRRSVGHGIRLVGTLKDGPDLNVMALYEK